MFNYSRDSREWNSGTASATACSLDRTAPLTLPVSMSAAACSAAPTVPVASAIGFSRRRLSEGALLSRSDLLLLFGPNMFAACIALSMVLR